jgi:hypothetical protein
MESTMLKKSDVATVWHAGTGSYYEAAIIRKMSKQEVIGETKAAAGEDPRPDTTIFKDVIKRVLGKSPIVYNDINKDKTKRRLKAAWLFPNGAQFNKIDGEFQKAFGDRLIEVGTTREFVPAGRFGGAGGGELFVRLTAY